MVAVTETTCLTGRHNAIAAGCLGVAELTARVLPSGEGVTCHAVDATADGLDSAAEETET